MAGKKTNARASIGRATIKARAGKGLHPHAKLIEGVGGRQIVANRYAITGEAVSNWCRRGIPSRYRPDFLAFASSHGLDVPRDFLQLTRGALA